MGRKLKKVKKEIAICMSANESAEVFGPLLGLKKGKFLKLIDEEMFIAGKFYTRKLVYIPSILDYLEKTPEERKSHPPQIGLREYWKKGWQKHLSEKSTAVEIGEVLGVSSKTVKRFINSNIHIIKKYFRYNGRSFDVDEINPGYLDIVIKDINE
ncbi:MAG: hypothetical protein ACRCZ9_07100 [Fusobacteriaceae bacterium]